MSETTTQRTARLLSMSNADLIMHAQDLTLKRDTLQEALSATVEQRDELLAALKKLNRAYVQLLENGRDRILSLGGECDPVDYMEQVDCNLAECRATIASVKGCAA